MGHFVAHDHGGFVVTEFELVQDAGVKRNLPARHAKRVDLFAADQVHLPLPLARTVVPLRGVRNDALGNHAQALQLRIAVRRQGPLLARLRQHLRILLGSCVLQLGGRHQLAHAGGLAHIHLRKRGNQCGKACGKHEGTARVPARMV